MMLINTNIQVLSRLRLLRLLSGFTQQRLAKEVGITQSTISNAERGFATLDADKLRRVAKALGVPVRDLREPD